MSAADMVSDTDTEGAPRAEPRAAVGGRRLLSGVAAMKNPRNNNVGRKRYRQNEGEFIVRQAHSSVNDKPASEGTKAKNVALFCASVRSVAKRVEGAVTLVIPLPTASSARDYAASGPAREFGPRDAEL